MIAVRNKKLMILQIKLMTSSVKPLVKHSQTNHLDQELETLVHQKCYESRKKFHKARKLYNRFKNEINKNYLLDCSKQYKQTTNKAYNDYQLQLENKLRNTSKYNGKDFWKILNRFAKNKKDDQSNISIETLYDYLKNLNTNIDNDNNNIDININIDNLSLEMEEILNSPKTADEIKSVVQN